MINGVPQNDMENGWVYWSNWDGVGDYIFNSDKEVYRVIATPSIGGTMNIITDLQWKRVVSSNKKLVGF